MTTQTSRNTLGWTATAPAALPVPSGPVGPVTAMMLRRTYRSLTLVAALGAAIAASGGGPLDRLGAGIAVPGGGFFATGHVELGLMTLGLLVPAFVIWWAVGAVLAMPAVWLGSAILAATSGAGTVTTVSFVNCVVVGGLVLVALASARRISWHRARARGRAVAAAIEDSRTWPEVTSDATFTLPDLASESSPEDLAALRFALDLALQPIDRWDGFLVMDQLRESAVRYQLNMIGYALATAQHTRTPAFSGYLAEGQRMAIEKMLEPRAWRYWRWENLIGNLAWDPDPCARDNVMLAGYWGVQIGLYTALNDDHRYDAPGSLTFRSGDESHPWDFRKLATQMRSNIVDSDYGLVPCEPHWIYPYCSSFALNTVALDERLRGGDLEARQETLARFRSRFEEEFVRPDGRLVAVRNRFGFSLPGSVVGGDAVVAYWLNATMPDIAQRIWWITRQRIPADGVMPKPGIVDRVDAGNYRVGSGGMSRAAVALAAREIGDHDVASAVEDWMREHAPPETQGGVWRHQELSVYGNLVALHARFTRQNAMREMITTAGEGGSRGPRLAAAPYPDVLVAYAVSDGRDLRLVLRPGSPDRGRNQLIIDRLIPGLLYHLTGATTDTLTASHDGTATLHVDLDDRLEITLRPSDERPRPTPGRDAQLLAR